MTRGPMATRTYATVFMKIGPLIEIELAVYNQLTSEHGVTRNQFTVDGHPVGSAPVDKVTGEIIEHSAIVKKIATSNGPVYVEDAEIEKLFQIKPNTLVVKGYQPVDLFGTAYVPNQPLAVEPAKKKVGTKKVVNETSTQVLAGLLDAMRVENVCAVCEMTTRGVPKPCVLLPDGTLWIVRSDDELREPRPSFQDTVPAEVIEAVRGQLVPFIQANTTTEPMDLTDVRSAAILEYAEAKAAEGDFGAPVVGEVVEERESSSTNDLMALLSASITAAASTE